MNKKLFLIMIAVSVIFGGSAAFAETKPWEDPNSGFNDPNAKTTTTTTGSTGGYDKIDKVITSTGATKNNGTVVSNAGSDKDKSFVDGFLNNAASKITGVNGTASAWSWTKKWKIGPDGKPMEVVETYHEGSLKVTGSNNPTPAPSPSAGSTPSSGSSSGSPAPSSSGPSTASVPPSSGSSPSSGSPTSSKPGSSGSAPTSPSSSAAPAPAPATPPVKGVNVAPVALPQGIPPQAIMAELGIMDQLTGQEQKFNSSVTPKTTAKPIPEDVRTKFSLDVADSMKDKVKVNIDDPDDPSEFPYQATFHHVFRTPAMDRYKVIVSHPDQVTGVYKPILTVLVPVYKMNFKNSTIESTQNRISDDKNLMNNLTAQSSAYSSSSSGSSGNSGSSNFGGSVNDNAEQVDMSDLYTNPENPPELAGQNLVAGSVPVAPGSSEPGSGKTGANQGSRTATGKSGSAYGNTASSNVSGNTGTQVAGTNSVSGTAPTGANAGTATQYSQGSRSSGAAGSSGSTGSSNSMLRQGSSGKSSLAYVGNEITPDQGGSESAYSGGDNSSVAGSETGQPTPEGMTGTNLGNAAAGSNESGTQLAMRTGSGQGDSSSGVTTGEVTTANRDYLISLTMKPAGAPVGQSFDFTDTPYPTSNTLAKDSKVTFIFDLSKQVKRESVQVVTFDGAAKNTVSLESLGNDMIDMSFNQPTAEAYVWVYGESEKGPFSYKLSIPVE